jgi:predicted nucleic acid-binding protein
MKAVLVDAGPLYALADRNDSWHDRVVSYLETVTSPLIVPVTVLPEACYLVAKFLGSKAEIELVASIQRGELAAEVLTKTDWSRTIEVMRKYSDADLGFVDASVVAVAERLRIRDVVTVDRTHFSLVRPRHCRSFELHP